MSTNATISVIMSVYREALTDIEVSINSILNQTYQNWELIVVIDDPTNEKAISYLQNLTTTETRIKLLKNENNVGLGASLNRAVGLASAPFCARMDTEDRSLPDRFERQINYMASHPETDLLFTQWLEIYEDGHKRERRPSAKDVRNIKKNFFLKSLLLHPTMMLKTEILKKHPYPAMSRPEDWVLFLELIRNNYKFDLLEDVLYEYKVDSRQKYQKVKAYSRNLLPYLIKNTKYYWKNIYFWLYTLRITIEYLISRNALIYNNAARVLTSVWKISFRSK